MLPEDPDGSCADYAAAWEAMTEAEQDCHTATLCCAASNGTDSVMCDMKDGPGCTGSNPAPTPAPPVPTPATPAPTPAPPAPTPAGIAPGTLPGPFGSHIEGASLDPSGNLYATHFRATADDSGSGNNVGRNVIGRADGTAWFTGEDGATFNGMKWDQTGDFVYLADVTQGKVVKLNTQNMTGEDFCSDAQMVDQGVPNDLALSKSGLLFLSGQDWGTSTGALWLCRANGEAVLLETMARANGIALSPDDATLYLTEAVGSPVANDTYAEGQRIWKYDVAVDGSISNKVEFFNFATDTAQPEASVDSDGMRTDIQGNLYVTRNGLTKVSIISPNGTLVSDLPLTEINNPTNLAIGGEQGDTIYVVGRCLGAGWSQGDGCVDTVQALHPGREWSWFQETREVYF